MMVIVSQGKRPTIRQVQTIQLYRRHHHQYNRHQYHHHHRGVGLGLGWPRWMINLIRRRHRLAVSSSPTGSSIRISGSQTH